MRKQIVRVAPWQAAKLSAVLYFILGIVMAVCLALSLVFGTPPEGGEAAQTFGWVLVVLVPFLYACAGLIIVPIMCWLYNVVAKWVGGIEISVEDLPSA